MHGGRARNYARGEGRGTYVRRSHRWSAKEQYTNRLSRAEGDVGDGGGGGGGGGKEWSAKISFPSLPRAPLRARVDGYY